MTKTEILHEGNFLALCRTHRWEFVQRINARGVVIIVAVTPERRLLLVEQVRPAMQGPVVELPAGLVGDIAGEENEDFSVAAVRELEEETGYRAEGVRYLTGGPPSAGLSSECLSFYRAYGLTRVGDGGGDETEDITVHSVALDEVENWLAAREKQGAVIDPKIYAGLYFIARERSEFDQPDHDRRAS